MTEQNRDMAWIQQVQAAVWHDDDDGKWHVKVTRSKGPSGFNNGDTIEVTASVLGVAIETARTANDAHHYSK